MNDLEALVGLSRWAGGRFDLIQAGGGNSSLKTKNNTLWVKASGVALSQVSEHNGFCELRLDSLQGLLETLVLRTEQNKSALDAFAIEQCQQAMISQSGRPSIETLLHAQMHRFTLHTHPISVVQLASQKDWKERLRQLFPEAVCVAYETPGAALALALYQGLKHQPDAKIVFLQNHGLIVSTPTATETQTLTQTVTQKLEQSLGLDLSAYAKTSLLSEVLQEVFQEELLTYYCNDMTVQNTLCQQPQLLTQKPVCPDQLVYCGPEPLMIQGELQATQFQGYQAKWEQYPRVILWDQACYLVGNSLPKCHEMMDVLRFHLLVTQGSPKTTLAPSEIAYLMNWSAEKYRQKITYCVSE